MAKNKNRQQPAKQQPRTSAQDTSKSSAESQPDTSSQAPSPMDMAHKSKQKKFGHN
ncbi:MULTISPECIES: hypothetical protein [unclassified Streptomyces]|uniref:hypothetical protein n=1 Tax=unclassified Streptomyces TaxID=2593676 RepID=UPI001BE692AC|nr:MULTISPECIES: hypothetical protein [unclassified Streptomyces]MBT2405973.1 hypothetical protein [Streptomyces sp. ISL-21]MBT2453906.1 hypothetical protein [Streptomyces sp. ISL-86]MBT2608569.1 hypothetical protein [Streptomyces sp. ISL-87]